jgi:hypothetical protein
MRDKNGNVLAVGATVRYEPDDNPKDWFITNCRGKTATVTETWEERESNPDSVVVKFEEPIGRVLTRARRLVLVESGT